MNNCENLRELILTDYLDGEADDKARAAVDAHLLQCADCRSLLKEAQEGFVMPLETVAREAVPAEIWISLQDRISARTSWAERLREFFGHMAGEFSYVKLVPVLGMAAVMLLTGPVILQNSRTIQAKEKAQQEYLVGLLASSGNSSEAASDAAANPIEEYFL
ncbi:MAG: zf-HC2 domain-containing protein [Candidatus Omnitrophica bacterium]|nr:zf-HC2 domain-containing protein [Candidatus Omnitrophota bacterium]